MLRKVAFVRAPRSLIVLNDPDQLHLGPHSTPRLAAHRARGSFELQLGT